MARCSYCGKEVVYPFKCPYCGRLFCSEHRLPEKHGCTGRPRAPPTPWRRRELLREERPIVRVRRRIIWTPSYTWVQLPFRISRREAQHLLIAGLALLVIMAIMVFEEGMIRLAAYHPLALLAALCAIAASFFAHEFAHKATALRYGFPAEFRIDRIGLLLSLLLSVLPGMIVFAPGAVVVAVHRPMYRREELAISAAGVTVNVVLAGLCLALAPFLAALGVGIWAYVPYWVGWFNAFIAIFNLIPFGALDGFKILVAGGLGSYAWITGAAGIAFISYLMRLHTLMIGIAIGLVVFALAVLFAFEKGIVW